MKFLSRLNRGALLTAAVIIAVAIYLIIVMLSQNAQKPAIMDVCKKYVALEVKYSTLPDKYKTANPDMPKDEKDKLISNMTAEFNDALTNNEQMKNSIINRLKDSIEKQAAGVNVVSNYKNDILSYKNFTFSGNTVTVTIEAGVTYKLVSDAVESAVFDSGDILILEKVGGKWKVVYSDLPHPSQENSKYPQGVIR